MYTLSIHFIFFFFQAEDGIRDVAVTGVQTCALPICSPCALLRLQLRMLRLEEDPQRKQHDERNNHESDWLHHHPNSPIAHKTKAPATLSAGAFGRNDEPVAGPRPPLG